MLLGQRRIDLKSLRLDRVLLAAPAFGNWFNLIQFLTGLDRRDNEIGLLLLGEVSAVEFRPMMRATGSPSMVFAVSLP